MVGGDGCCLLVSVGVQGPRVRSSGQHPARHAGRGHGTPARDARRALPPLRADGVWRSVPGLYVCHDLAQLHVIHITLYIYIYITLYIDIYIYII